MNKKNGQSLFLFGQEIIIFTRKIKTFSEINNIN